MLALVFEGPRAIRFATDVAAPRVEAPDEAVVEVLATGLCGSDLHPYLGREPARNGVVPGHEVVGRVVEVGTAVTVAAVGDRVVVPFSTSCGRCDACARGLSSRCDKARLFGWGDPDPSGSVLHGGQAQQLRVPSAEGTMVRLPERVSDGAGVLLADNLPTGWYAAARGGVRPGTRVAVIGLGSVGLCTIVACLALGASEVIGIDPVATRRQRAVDLGGRAVAPAEAEEAPGSVDVAIDAAGPPEAQRLAADLVRPGGNVSIIAVQTASGFAIDPAMAYDKNLTITAGRAPVRSLLDQLVPMVVTGRLAVPEAAVVTHAGVPLAQGPDMYRRFADHEEGLVKVIFAPTS